MVKSKAGWRNQPKQNKPSTDGKCPYCNKNVKSLEAHIKTKHKGEKVVK